MKKIPFILFIFILIFASSTSATVYKWVDKNGVVNFADDASRIPRDYRNKVEELNTARMGPSTPSQAPSGKTIVSAPSQEAAKQPPPIAQTLVREGDFAIKLAEALKIGKAETEAEAESMLASAGIAPKNGWIADYPMTPDIIGELEKAVGEAADGQKLALGKNEALKALRKAAVEYELPIIAEGPDENSESPPPTTPQYTTPSAIDDYYYTEGPPIVTYYPPPWDYYYMYAWIPGPFWCSGFYFPGFFILHDFHRGIHRNGHTRIITNHMRDPGTGRIFTVDAARRHAPRNFGGRNTPPMRGFDSTEARKGARSIFERSRGRVGSGSTSMPMSGRGPNDTNPAYARPARGNGKQVYHKESRPSGFSGRNSNDRRPPAVDRRMSRIPGETGSQGMRDRDVDRPERMSRQNGMNIQRPFAGEPRSFSPRSQDSQRSFGPSPQAGGRHSGSSSMGGERFFRVPSRAGR
ncbi:MAG: hypothetical protein A2157_12070 [Deltaproteobacteria bacterium RBG_16_47_11]|nr:MAG: hypothetical protein A2157_12070 [Deltaproteobacteria bacterium RBG_16_47_11]